LLLRQAIRAGRLGLLAVHLVGEPLQRPGRLLHALLRLGVGRLLVGLLRRLARRLGGLGLALRGLRRLQRLRLVGDLLLLLLQLLLLLRRHLRVGRGLLRLVGQVALPFRQLTRLLVGRLLAVERLLQALQLAAGRLLGGVHVLLAGVHQVGEGAVQRVLHALLARLLVGGVHLAQPLGDVGLLARRVGELLLQLGAVFRVIEVFFLRLTRRLLGLAGDLVLLAAQLGHLAGGLLLALRQRRQLVGQAVQRLLGLLHLCLGRVGIGVLQRLVGLGGV